MTQAQIELQNALTTTFLANLAFLSEYDKELYYRIDELSRMIENKTYKELTDLILGIIRTILKNDFSITTKGARAKNELILELLENDQFLAFLKSIHIFEWTSRRNLEELNFADHLRLFISNSIATKVPLPSISKERSIYRKLGTSMTRN